eukprot:3368848-Pyramimonas_sp.AAC.1
MSRTGKDGDQETTKEEKEEEKKAQEAKQAREDELRKKLEAIRMNTLKARCIQNGASFKSQGAKKKIPGRCACQASPYSTR